MCLCDVYVSVNAYVYGYVYGICMCMCICMCMRIRLRLRLRLCPVSASMSVPVSNLCLRGIQQSRLFPANFPLGRLNASLRLRNAFSFFFQGPSSKMLTAAPAWRC